MGDDAVRMFGIVIAICGAMFVFGGETFAIWNLGLEDKTADSEISLKFATNIKVFMNFHMGAISTSLPRGNHS